MIQLKMFKDGRRPKEFDELKINVLELDFNILPLYGIYFLYSGEKLKYIGKSINVSSRISQHIGSKLWKKNKIDRAFYMPIKRKPEACLSITEDYLIGYFKPIGNKHGLNGDRMRDLPIKFPLSSVFTIISDYPYRAHVEGLQ